MGPRVSADSTGDIVANPGLGAGLMDSCAGCHGRPRGAAGFGGDVVTRPDSRDSPHLFGLGLQEMLAQEITDDLRAIRDAALAAAASGGSAQAVEFRSSRDSRRDSKRSRRDRKRCRRHSGACFERSGPAPGGSVTRRLTSKGIDYGSITAHPDGTLDLSDVHGFDADLRVAPFFAEGATVSIREFIVGAFNNELGMQAPDPIPCGATDRVSPQQRVRPAGFVFDPSEDVFERPRACSPSADPDGDGITNEVDTAVVDHMEFYLLFKPGHGRETSRTADGRSLMEKVDCTSCHVPDLKIERDRRVGDVETVHDPVNGIFNRLFATAGTRFVTVDDGEAYALLVPAGDPFVVRDIFTDFKRHDLGEAFHEREYDGAFRTEFITEPLWGVGTTAPYGHDGRSIDLVEVILRQAGEAQASRDAFAALSADRQQRIVEFPQTLVLFPPDDTASNLNPGDPNGDPQDPADHGSINLGALFQIPEEGPE